MASNPITVDTINPKPCFFKSDLMDLEKGEINHKSDQFTDPKLAGAKEEYQSVCRICHLSAEEIGRAPIDPLTELGCRCKGELGVAHSRCAEAWFRVRGNRVCEICGENAKNVAGGGNTSSGFVAERIEFRPVASGGNTSVGFVAERIEFRPAATFSGLNDGNGRQPLCFYLAPIIILLCCILFMFSAMVLSKYIQ